MLLPGSLTADTPVSSSDRAVRAVSAAVRFLSLEPLIGPIETLDLRGIHWVIVGGESGPSARVMRVEWVRDIHTQCQRAGVPFFFKQWGGVRKSRNGRTLDRREWNELPLAARATRTPARAIAQR